MKFTLLLLSFSVFASGTMTLTQELAQRSKASGSKMPKEIKMQFSEFSKKLNKSGLTKRALSKGVKLPEFKLAGKSIKDFYSEKPVVLKFYRGSWCPYCQIEMKYYQKYKKDIEAKGYQVIILTPDTNKEIAKFKKKQNITYSIYQDKNNRIAKKLGLAFKVDPNIVKIYNQFGINLDKSQGNAGNELPLPGTYIINKLGEITYSFIDIDYTKRLDPIDLLKRL